MTDNNKKAKYIHNIRKSLLLEIIEKSFPTIYGDITISDRDDSVFISIATPNQKNQVANVTFYDYDVLVESPIDFPRNNDLIEIRFLDVMMNAFQHEGYREEWEKAHEKDFDNVKSFGE